MPFILNDQDLQPLSKSFLAEEVAASLERVGIPTMLAARAMPTDTIVKPSKIRVINTQAKKIDINKNTKTLSILSQSGDKIILDFETCAKICQIYNDSMK